MTSNLFSNLYVVYLDQLFEEIQRTHSIPKSALEKVNKTVAERFKITYTPDSNAVVERKEVTKRSTKKQFDVSAITAETALNATDLKGCTKEDLTKLCKIKNLKCTGTKDDIIKRLTSKTPVIEKFLKCSPINIQLNQFGNREHQPTRLVFSEDKTVVGYQQDDGSIGELNDEMIEKCNQYKFKYKLPSNLDRNIKDKDIDERLSKLIDDDDDE